MESRINKVYYESEHTKIPPQLTGSKDGYPNANAMIMLVKCINDTSVVCGKT
jgi:hypothetical protein